MQGTEGRGACEVAGHPSAAPSLAGRVWWVTGGLFSRVATFGQRAKFTFRSAKPLYNFLLLIRQENLDRCLRILQVVSFFLHGTELVNRGAPTPWQLQVVENIGGRVAASPRVSLPADTRQSCARPSTR